MHTLDKDELQELSQLKAKTLTVLHEPIKAYLELVLNKPIRRIVAVGEEETKYYGYCETCAYEETSIDVYYKDQGGVLHRYVIRDTFSNIVSALANVNKT